MMRVRVHSRARARARAPPRDLGKCVRIYVYVRIHVRTYVCVCVCVYVHTADDVLHVSSYLRLVSSGSVHQKSHNISTNGISGGIGKIVCLTLTKCVKLSIIEGLEL